MVSTALHYIIGLTILKLWKPKEKKVFSKGLIAAGPDIDGIIFLLLFAGKAIFGYSLTFLENNQFWLDLLSHRGISHSLTLFVVIIAALFLFKVRKENIAIFSVLWGSHLVFDYITAWKMFPFLPFSHAPFYLGIVEIFDSILVFLTAIAFAIILGMQIQNKHKKIPIAIALSIFIGFGFVPAIFMGEYNVQTIVLSSLIFALVLVSFYVASKKSSSKVIQKKAYKSLAIVACITVLYLAALIINQGVYAAMLDTSITNIEPLEEFAFNYNAHTFEVEQENTILIGVISWKGIEEQKEVTRFQGRDVSPATKQSYLNAYHKAIHINWFNHPVFTFHRTDGGAEYANIRYAKTFLENPHMPGPQNGLDATLKGDLLVGYGDNWLD